MGDLHDNSKLSEKNGVSRLGKMFSTMPEIDGVKITCMKDAMEDKVRFKAVMAYFCDVRMLSDPKKRYKNGSLKINWEKFEGFESCLHESVEQRDHHH